MRHRFSALTVVTLLSGALLTSPPATATGETCQGRPATIVGTGPTIQGTEGDDVVVTGASEAAYTYGGNDLVCLTADVNDQIWVRTGMGNDVVDASSAIDRRKVVDLGEGIDHYLGSSGANDITAEGADDTIDAITGQTSLALSISEPVGDVTGSYRGSGERYDNIVVLSPDRAIELELDELVVIDGVFAADIAGFNIGHVQAPDAVVRGNSNDNYLTGRGCSIRVDGAGGDDSIATNAYLGELLLKFDCETKSRLSGGSGDDTIRGRDGRDRLVGNGGNDELQGGADADVMLGGGGKDKLDGDAGRDVLRGNGGNDTLDGGSASDILLGNRGRDKANGRQGRDWCVAESERRCER